MPKIQNSFLKGKMNKDLDERLVPKGEYREAQNILITQSEGSDVGAIENIQGNALAVPMPTIVGTMETIGYFADNLNKKAFWFITDFAGDNNDIRTMSRAQSTNTCQILMADLNNTSEEAKIIVQGHFLNFSKNHLITGVNLIDDLLFFTDNYNQPRKINVTKAIADNTYYTREEQISVAKVSPFLAPILKNNDGDGDGVTLTGNDIGITSDYLKDKFVRFSYRYKYEDGEYTVIAPFTQIIFKPLNDGQIQNVLTSDREKTDTQDVYSKTIVDIMKNHYNKAEIRIPLPGDNYQTNPNANWDNYLNISKIEILIKESDQDVVKVVKEIDVNDNQSFIDLVETMPTIDENDPQNNNDINYYRHVYKFTYKSEKPYKILEDKQITRVFDQVPLRAKSQEISGNRIIYGNFTENYDLPIDDNGKTGVNYVIKNITKGDYDSLTVAQVNKNVYKYHSVKQRRDYQVGIVLSDIFGRQSTVLLSKNDTDTITSTAETNDLSQKFNNEYSWSDVREAFGRSLQIQFDDSSIVDNLYNGDINSDDYNPHGWYSYKIVVKQQQQEYYNIYTNHPADNWNNDSNTHDDILGFSWISLYGNNINKVPRDVSEADEIREGVAGSDVKLFPKVVKKSIPVTMPDGTVTDFFSPLNNMSMQGPDQDTFDVMTVGTAREQGILTKGDRDKDRVHDFVMAKRNPLLAQVKSLGQNNRVKYSLDFIVNNNNDEEKDEFQIGNGNDINPFIRVGQQVTQKVFNVNSKKAIALSNIGKKVINVRVDNDEQEHFDSRTIILDGDEIDDAKGGSAMMQVGQIIEFRTGGSTGLNLSLLPFNDSADNTLKVGSATAAFLQIAWNNSQTDDDSSGVFNITHTDIPSGTTITNVVTSGAETTITMSAASTAAITSYVIVTGGAGGNNLFMDENNVDESFIKTTAVVEQHGDEYVIRRPILQKVELNEDSTRTILHFDRRVFPDNIDTSSNKNQCLALFDPLTIKQVETENDGSLVYQKIKMSHEHEFNAGDEIVIQNLEEQPVAVTTGLTVLETDPVESKLDIYYESSTSGLIRDLHKDISKNNRSLEISYYNTFILSGGGNIQPVLQNGTITDKVGQWHVEESRIKGEFNGKSVDFGVKAYLVDPNHSQRVRSNALIHSGIFNAKTDINETNQFSIGENITKAVDIQNGSIQKLYAEDTNLIIFQENKVSRALIDKDIIFTQEGQPLTTASKLVIGQVGAFAGEYGISKNPESFAVCAGRKYFSDKNRGVILRLSQDGLTPISDASMRSFFRDNLQNANRVYGMYDEQKNKYVISLQNTHGVASTYNPEYGDTADSTTITKDDYATLSFDEGSKGWVSFYTYKPTFGFSIDNKFYTYNLQNLYEHYRDDVQRCMFYKSVYTDPANVEFVFNDQPTTVKNFHTIDYEGTSGWKMASSETDMHVAYPILSSDTNVSSISIPINFVNKENKYYGHVRNNTTTTSLNQIIGVDLSGVKGYFNKVKMQYWKPNEAVASSVNKGELYAVGSETVYSSQ